MFAPAFVIAKKKKNQWRFLHKSMVSLSAKLDLFDGSVDDDGKFSKLIEFFLINLRLG